jgi:ABC-type uncharacterized transport system permease subunit
MNIVINGLLLLAAVSLGLRTTSALRTRVHPMLRLVIALAAGVVLSLAFLQLCDSYRILQFGVGLLISLSPVGVFDLAKWWFLWRT